MGATSCKLATLSPATGGTVLIGISAFRMNASCLDLVRALDPSECHLVEEGFVSVVPHDPARRRQSTAFCSYSDIAMSRPPKCTDQQRPIGVQGLAKFGRHGNGRPHVCPAHPRHCRRHRPAIRSWCPCSGGTPHNRKPSGPASAGLIFLSAAEGVDGIKKGTLRVQFADGGGLVREAGRDTGNSGPPGAVCGCLICYVGNWTDDARFIRLLVDYRISSVRHAADPSAHFVIASAATPAPLPDLRQANAACPCGALSTLHEHRSSQLRLRLRPERSFLRSSSGLEREGGGGRGRGRGRGRRGKGGKGGGREGGGRGGGRRRGGGGGGGGKGGEGERQEETGWW